MGVVSTCTIITGDVVWVVIVQDDIRVQINQGNKKMQFEMVAFLRNRDGMTIDNIVKNKKQITKVSEISGGRNSHFGFIVHGK